MEDPNKLHKWSAIVDRYQSIVISDRHPILFYTTRFLWKKRTSLTLLRHFACFLSSLFYCPNPWRWTRIWAGEKCYYIGTVGLMPVIHKQEWRTLAYCMAPLTKATSSGEEAIYPVCSACWECPPSSPSIWSMLSISIWPASFTCTVWHRHRARRKSSSFS